MTAVIPGLIDKQDGFELVRDRIATILAEETVSQQALATAGGEDPAQWKLRVYTERANVWEQFLGDNVTDFSPLINVWFENSVFPENSGNKSLRQKSESIYHIDCYGYGLSADVPAGGHSAGDKLAALESHRALRLVRNILMSPYYRYLADVRGADQFVWGRWPQSITSFQPTQGDRVIENVLGTRLSLRVDFNETAATGDETTLIETVFVDVKRAEDGQVIAQAEYDYTVP